MTSSHYLTAMKASEILTLWIRIARKREDIPLVLALWHARDICDGIYDSEEVRIEITKAFDAMDQENEDLKIVREEMGL